MNQVNVVLGVKNTKITIFSANMPVLCSIFACPVNYQTHVILYYSLDNLHIVRGLAEKLLGVQSKILDTCRPAGALDSGNYLLLYTCRPAGAKVSSYIIYIFCDFAC